MSITLYHLPNSRSQRIIWLFTELNLEFNLITVERTANGEAPESLKQIHPLGKVPIVVIEENSQKTVLAETSAIVDYFAYLYPKQSIFTPENIAYYVYYKNFAESSVMPNLALKQIFARLVSFSPFFAKPVTKAIKNGVDERYLNQSLNEQLVMIDNQLKVNDFLAGNHLTGADILMQFILLALSVSVPNFTKFSHIQTYLQRIENLPSYKQTLEKGGFDSQEFIQYWKNAW